MIMKTLLLALCLALMLLSGSALKCNNCVPRSGGRCTNTVETCGYKKDACISARFTNYPFNYFRRCIAMSDCLLLQSTSGIVAQCCQRDLCN
ncbi:CD59B glycoprotein-like [Clarias gariepinus]|uniref:CD59B glycoprotein-like n=1 Tax=Clarias gariepinus TaxID=13013 RepID=UPI00234D12D9|nr:CD59B glycoprotein-like [Clarias gariepinus]